MEKLIVLLFDLGLLAAYLFIGVVLLILIQLISYRVFKFNLYKYLKYNLIDKELMR